MASRSSVAFMRLALTLAGRAMGRTSPNPMVGAVIVRRGRIVGQGYHRRAGLPHAEVEALRRAGRRARGATMYVTLEPCNHAGRTPPCCDALIRAGIARVVVAMKDPNPITNGRGLARLRRAGLRVSVGTMAAQAQALNAPFIKFITQRLPWVTAKMAQSLDGKIATRTGESRWISSEPARRMAHRLRAGADAVLVGANTVLRDDPRLTVRHGAAPALAGRPLKVIVDSRLRLPLSSRCLSGRFASSAIIATTQRAGAKRGALRRRGVRVLTFAPARGRVPLRPLLRTLARRYNVMSVLLEGGGELVAGALQERLVDRLLWCIAPLVIGGSTAPTSVGGSGAARLSQAIRLADMRARPIGKDLVVEAAVVYPGRARRR